MRKIISLLLCAVLMAGFILPVAAEQEEVEADLVITDLETFLEFAEACRLDSYSRDLVVSLETDIDLTGTDFTAIPWFGGTFMGNQHEISGLKIKENGSILGLFRIVALGATVRDLSVKGEIAPGGSREQVGGIVGCNEGTVENCRFEGSVAGASAVGGIVGCNGKSGIVTDCVAVGSVQGIHFVGGIVGENEGIVEDCENKSQVNATAQQNQVNISDITVGTILGTESALTVTDIGGIAGTNTGVIRRSTNRGTVGYQQMGYNIGGIAGSHSGYLVDCVNYGVVSGRKDVGGIVGQAEPWTQVQFDADTMQLLKLELEILSARIEKLTTNTENNVETIENYLDLLEMHRDNAQQAVDTILAPELQDAQVYKDALQLLADSLSGMEAALQNLFAATEDATDQLKADIQAVSDQMDVISALLENGEESVGGTVEDTSDADTAEDLQAKTENCQNFGQVQADRNVGGIVGSMGFENDLDPEADVTVSGSQSLNVSTGVRCVVLQCVNSGVVNGKKAQTGGIVGLQSLGLLRDSVQAGTVTGAEYTGGIAGRSLGYIRSCAVRGIVTGTVAVGGIAGSGRIVSDCRSMVTPTADEKLGAILGFREENGELTDNLYTPLGKDPGAVDGISYDGQAQPMALEDFLALEGLPEAFLQVSVRFVFEDGEETVILLTPGQALDKEQIPAVPEKQAHVGCWAGLQDAALDRVLTDLQFNLAYTPYYTTLASQENREGKSVLLVIGSYHPDSQVQVEKLKDGPRLGERESLLEAWSFAVPGDSHTHGIRVLTPDKADTANLRVYVRRDGKWEAADFTVEGSYLAVSLECGDDAVAIASYKALIPWWHWVVVGVGGLLLVSIPSAILIRRNRKRKQAAQAPATVE